MVKVWDGSSKVKPFGALHGKPIVGTRPLYILKYLAESVRKSQMRCLQYMGLAAYMAGEVIFNQGDFGDHFYIILSGAVDVSVDEGKQVRPTP